MLCEVRRSVSKSCRLESIRLCAKYPDTQLSLDTVQSGLCCYVHIYITDTLDYMLRLYCRHFQSFCTL